MQSTIHPFPGIKKALDFVESTVDELTSDKVALDRTYNILYKGLSSTIQPAISTSPSPTIRHFKKTHQPTDVPHHTLGPRLMAHTVIPHPGNHVVIGHVTDITITNTSHSITHDDKVPVTLTPLDGKVPVTLTPHDGKASFTCTPYLTTTRGKAHFTFTPRPDLTIYSPV